MSKIINSDIIIGNFIIEAVEKNDFEVKISQLYDFDLKLSEKLIEYNFYTKFDPINVIEFQEEYPFFIKSVNKTTFCVDNSNNKEHLKQMLIRYFRIGIPKIVSQEIKNISEMILEG